MTRRPPIGVRWIQVDDGAVLYNAGTGRFADLNASAAELWQVLSERDWSLDVAVAHLTSAHGLALDEAQRVVASFTDDLVRTGMLDDDDG